MATAATSTFEQILKVGLDVLEKEARTIHQLRQYLDAHFIDACHLLLRCTGRAIVMGMGKSGHIGKKIAATLSSTGTPAIFVHPAEALHGDLGMLTSQDVVLALSNSGETTELNDVLPIIKHLQIPLIAITGERHSTLAKAADKCLFLGHIEEAGHIQMIPTCSSIASLALGDALAITVLQLRGFTVEDFARSHPGGKIGRRLRLKVSDIMHTGSNIPMVTDASLLTSAVLAMTKKRLGMTIIVAAQNPHKVVGIYTDGDLSRTLEKGLNLYDIPIAQVMITSFRHADPDMLAITALQLMKQHKINGFPVIDEQGHLIGAFNMHDLLHAGIL